MEFKFKLENIVFYIEVKEAPHYKPPKKFSSFNPNEIKSLKNGQTNFYSLIIQSEKEGQSLKHYIGGLILTSNKEEVSKELQEVLEDFDYIDQILKEWELLESSEGPAWKRDQSQ